MQKPIFRWVGGKQRLVKTLLEHMPAQFSNYHEPFLGAGSLFLAVKSTLDNPSRFYHLNDSNGRVMQIFSDISMMSDREIENTLNLFKKDHSKDFFDQVKNDHNGIVLLYVLKASFNGLYRVNKKGEFNAPFNKEENINFNLNNILEFKKLVSDRCEFKSFDFNSYLNMQFQSCKINKGDFMYIDPPYYPINQKTNFSAYSDNGFSQDDHDDLMKCCFILDKIGVKFMLSNSNTKYIRNSLKEFNIHEVTTKRSVSASSEYRGNIKELIITNYEK